MGNAIRRKRVAILTGWARCPGRPGMFKAQNVPSGIRVTPVSAALAAHAAVVSSPLMVLLWCAVSSNDWEWHQAEVGGRGQDPEYQRSNATPVSAPRRAKWGWVRLSRSRGSLPQHRTANAIHVMREIPVKPKRPGDGSAGASRLESKRAIKLARTKGLFPSRLAVLALIHAILRPRLPSTPKVDF